MVLDFASKEDWEAVTKSKEYVTATAADAPKCELGLWWHEKVEIG